MFLPSKRQDTDDSLDAILEVHAIVPPNSRSWFWGEQVVEGTHCNQMSSFDAEAVDKDGKLLLITPVDPVFLLIPVIRAVFKVGVSPDDHGFV